MSKKFHFYNPAFGNMLLPAGRMDSWHCFIYIAIWLLSFFFVLFVVDEFEAVCAPETDLDMIRLIFILFALYLCCIILIKRAHDLNWSGVVIGLVIAPIPVVQPIMLLYLVFRPGKAEDNRYGVSPLKGSLVKKEEHVASANLKEEAGYEDS